jgi:hypothetical protein
MEIVRMDMKMASGALIVLFSFSFVTCKRTPDGPHDSVDVLKTFETELAIGLEPALSPDGKSIAYTNQGNIWTMDTSGLNQKQLTTNGGDVMPRWSPDGQKIGFIRTTQGIDDQGVLYFAPASGGSATQLVFNEYVGDALIQTIRNLGDIGTPIWDWSPDGKYVALLQNASQDTATFLKIIDLTNGNEVFGMQIFQFGNNSNGSSFQWSFIPNEILFNVIGKNSEYLAKLNITGNVVTRDSAFHYVRFITKNDALQQFAFITLSDSMVGYSGQEAMTINQALDIVRPYYPFQNNGSLTAGLKWSPDGKYFLYENEQSVGGALGYYYSALFVFSVDRNKNYQLTFKGDAAQPHNHFFEWAKSGNIVYFERFGKINSVKFEQEN